MAKQIHRANSQSPDEQAREKAIHEQFRRERPSLKGLLDNGYELIDADSFLLARGVMQALRRCRETANLSLDEVSTRSGIDKSTLSRLENGITENPTIPTLGKYAGALGKRLMVTLEDA